MNKNVLVNAAGMISYY